MIRPATRRALAILREHGPLSPTEFAEKMWPDSPAWEKVYKCGPYGASRGRAIVRSGGGFLGKLFAAGLVEPGSRLDRTLWSLSERGRKALAGEALE